MTNARDRVRSKRERQKLHHLNRIEEAKKQGPVNALGAAWAYFLSSYKHCTSDHKADQIGVDVFQYLIKKADELPRRST